MARLFRTILALVVLAAFAGGTLHVHPCSHASGDRNSDACAADGHDTDADGHDTDADGHDDAPAPEHHAHHCLCPCHVPALAAVAPSVERIAEALAPSLAPGADDPHPGYPEPPFRPPCA